MASSVAREGRARITLGRWADAPDAGSIMVGHIRIGEQVAQEFLTDGIDLVEVQAGGMSGPNSQHSSPGTGFEPHRQVDVGQVGRQPSQAQWRGEMLMLDLLLAADGLGWQAFRVVQKESACWPMRINCPASQRSTAISSIWKLSR
jgi:hypothetical protein